MKSKSDQDKQILTLQELCAAAYQALGAADGPVEMLDNLSDAANGRPLRHEPGAGLPWVPEHYAKGYVIVPAEPTKEMIKAGQVMSGFELYREFEVANIYKDMIAAAKRDSNK